MGSLMGGWDSPVYDPKSVICQRNKSLTKEEIDSYWKTKKGPDGEHLGESSGLLSGDQENMYKGARDKPQRSMSFPLTGTREAFMGNDSRPDGERIDHKTNCWWTRSNWAFLNEPPVTNTDVPTYRYAAQHHVTDFSRFKADSGSNIMA